MDVGGEQRFVAFFRTLFGRNDDTIAHLGHGGHFRIALVFVPSFFVDLNLYQLALGRFDFDMGRVNGHNRPKHMLVGAVGEAWRREEETRERDHQP